MKLGGVVIRLATEVDTGAVIECIAAAYAAYEATIPDLPPVLDGIAEAVGEGRVWLVADEVGIAGAVILSVDGAVAMLENVAVAPRCKGSGHGRRLIDKAVGVAVQQGCTEIRLNTHAAMTSNIALYEHLGWTVSDRGGHRVSMVRDLSA